VVHADLVVENFEGLPFIRRDFEQLYLGLNAKVKSDDIVFSNKGKLVLKNDLWQITLGQNSKVKWSNEGKVWQLNVMQGTAMLSKLSDRKAYLQLKTPQSLSSGEIQNLLVYVNQDQTKLWLSEGELNIHSDEASKSKMVKSKLSNGEFLEYRSNDTVMYKVTVSDQLLDEIEASVLNDQIEALDGQTAIAAGLLAKKRLDNQHRKASQNYSREQRSELIQSIQEAVLEDGAFSFSIPVSPPPK